ncbi:MAG: hypothetical protein PHW10_05245 [Candidatus Peribacteraceae bacterium]|nr:hypothetical protein [Candidatus Peribacteraceae bacterium]
MKSPEERRETLIRQALPIIRSRVPSSEASQVTRLQRQLIDAVLRHDYAGDSYRDVSDPVDREALRTFSAWRGRRRDAPTVREYEEWGQWLARKFGTSEKVSNMMRALNLEKKIEQHNDAKERVIVPLIYRRVVGMGEGKHVRIHPKREYGRNKEYVAKYTNKVYYGAVPMPPQQKKPSTVETAKEHLARFGSTHNPVGLWGTVTRQLVGPKVYDIVTGKMVTPEEEKPEATAAKPEDEKKDKKEEKKEEAKKAEEVKGDGKTDPNKKTEGAKGEGAPADVGKVEKRGQGLI